jgi:4-diphosphocytidyl-2-C-methyl-D-erythritol kinase
MMTKLQLDAHAKINLTLDVLGVMDNGYHDLRMVMQSIELCDKVELEGSSNGIELNCSDGYVPCNSSNTAWKAAALIIGKYGIKGVKIRIDKNIPVSSGLAGGSADAAAVIKGMNELFSLEMKKEEMIMLGKMVGADVPFCICEGTKLAEGIGDRLSDLPEFSGVDTVVIKPKASVSTAMVYRMFDFISVPDSERPNLPRLLDGLMKKDMKLVAENMRNVLEKVTIPKYPIVQEAKDALIERGALGSMMSGSGPSVFGLFSCREDAVSAFRSLREDERWQCFLTSTN